MAFYIEHLGLDFLFDSKESLNHLTIHYRIVSHS